MNEKEKPRSRIVRAKPQITISRGKSYVKGNDNLSNQQRIKNAGGGDYLKLEGVGVPQTYLDAIEKYGTDKQINAVRAYKLRHAKNAAGASKVARKSLTKTANATQLNKFLKDTIRAYGQVIDESNYPAANLGLDAPSIGLIPLAPPFFDTAVFKTPLDKMDLNGKNEKQIRIAHINDVLGTTANPVKVKYLPSNGGWLVQLATVPVEQVMRLFENDLTRAWLYNIDYTQDFAGYLNVDKGLTIGSRAKAFITDLDEYNDSLKMDSCKYEKDGILFKGNWNLWCKNPDNKQGRVQTNKYKVYDKINSFMCNTGIAPIGLTMHKSITAPREPHIGVHLNNEKFASHSITRVEVTLTRDNIHNRDMILNTIALNYKPCIVTGDTRAWFEKFLCDPRPVVCVDLTAITVNLYDDDDNPIPKNARWGFQHVDNIEYTSHIGGVIIAYYIEGNGSDACVQGMVAANKDDALQKCIGSRPVTYVTVENMTGKHTVEHYGIDAKFKPTPTMAVSFHDMRGAKCNPPEMLKKFWWFNSERRTITPRKIEPIKKVTLRNIVPVKNENDNFVHPESLKYVNAKGQTVFYDYADKTNYKNRNTIHEIAWYGIVDDTAMIVTEKSKTFRVKKKCSFKNPKFYNTTTGNYQQTR